VRLPAVCVQPFIRIVDFNKVKVMSDRVIPGLSSKPPPP
jgi:hypothetical protein